MSHTQIIIIYFNSMTNFTCLENRLGLTFRGVKSELAELARKTTEVPANHGIWGLPVEQPDQHSTTGQ